jgi:four helix bundle protein
MEKPHKRLDAWKLSMELVLDIYRVTAKLPADERYGLVAQMRSAAVSVPSNIAEGAARHTKREFANFLHVAQASLSELDTQLEVAVRLNYLTPDEVALALGGMQRIDKMLTGLIKSLRREPGLTPSPQGVRREA